MTGWLSRRGFLGVTGGIAAALWVAAGCRPRREGTSDAEAASGGYIDHDGWMLTAADTQKLNTAPADSAATP